MKGAELIVKTLERYSVSHIFGLPGDATSFFRALTKSPIQFITMRNEQGVGYAINGYARVAKKPGVAYVSRGAGGTNVLTGIACAYLEGTPAIFITDQVSRKESIYPDSYMFINLEDIYRPVSKGVDVVWRAQDIPDIMSRAWADAKRKTPGPRCIIVPQDVFNEDTDPIYLDPVVSEDVEIDSLGAVERLQYHLEKSGYPILIFGPGIKEFVRSEELKSFLDRISVPFFTTRHAKGIIYETHPLHYGVARNDILSALSPQIDLVITLGYNISDKDDEYSWWLDRTKIEHIDISDSPPIETLCFQPAEKFRVDWKDFFQLAQEKLPVRSHPTLFRLSSQEWQERCRRMTLDRFGDFLLGDVLNQNNLGAILTSDDIITVETGLTRRYILTVFKSCGPHIIGSGTLSALGFSVPAAIGASIADPNARVVVICGDGALLMNVSELATIRRLKLPVKIIVVADGSYGYMKYLQYEAFGSCVGVDFTNPDFELLARAFGFEYLGVHQETELELVRSLIEDRNNPALIVLYQKYQYK
ncbi:MAG: thiamine pyrophosphate-binding protein [Candidatus Sungbacteria bacterium]|nr:thiamine pyrophosphate-binding protein [Candidatus Sungbacteria bacterium]